MDGSKNREFMIALLSLVGVLSGCASAQTNPRRAQAASSAVSAGAVPIRHADSLSSLESQLTKVHSQKVVISTHLLRSLLHNERIVQGQCKDLSGQLEALKNIDLEETGVVQ